MVPPCSPGQGEDGTRGVVNKSLAIKPTDEVTPLAQPAQRRLLFLSHATPEDNDFARWLATQLAIAGYEVWCDLTKLLGGEKFWTDIDEAIDLYAFRVLFASTLESNRKPGALRELKMALDAGTKHDIKDFLVPLKVDQFPFAATDSRIKDLNFVRFDESWSAGLKQLLELLEREGAPKSATAGPACVREWLQRSQAPQRRHVVRDDTCVSNWFGLTLPDQIYLHRFKGPNQHLEGLVSPLGFPYRIHGNGMLTFLPSHDLHAAVGGDWETTVLNATVFVEEGSEELDIAPFDSSNMVTGLVQKAWDAAMEQRGFAKHTQASGFNAWFFKAGQLEKNRGYFVSTGGKRSFRQLVGLKSKKTPDGGRTADGYWHYAVSASPQLHGVSKIAMHHHVIFTDDGHTPWSSAERMHKARRSVCKQWWNAEWRDRLFAMCASLGGDDLQLQLPVGTDVAITVSMKPMSFTSPWSFFEDNETGLDESAEIELVEDQYDDA